MYECAALVGIKERRSPICPHVLPGGYFVMEAAFDVRAFCGRSRLICISKRKKSGARGYACFILVHIESFTKAENQVKTKSSLCSSADTIEDAYSVQCNGVLVYK